MFIALKNGLIFTFTLIVVYGITYFIQPSLFSKALFTIPLFTVLSLVFAFLNVHQVNKKKEYNIGFGEGLLFSFITYATGFSLALVLFFIHYNLDAGYADIIDTEAKEATMQVMSNLGGAEQDVNALQTKIQDLDFKTTTFTVVMRIILNIIWGLFLALGGGIIAIVLKNK